MVGSLSRHDRTLLDSSDSEFSEADHIRSHHSVVVIHDDNTAGAHSFPHASKTSNKSFACLLWLTCNHFISRHTVSQPMFVRARLFRARDNARADSGIPHILVVWLRNVKRAIQ